MPRDEHPWPSLRWVAIAWLLVYVPVYATAYPITNFLFLCNLGVTLTSVGLILGHRLLVSSQAIAAPVIGIAWALDAGWKLVTGDFLYGATEYMWDPQFPLLARILSLYHLAWPLLLLWCLSRAGYDRRGWPLQVAIAGCGILASRALTPPVENVNFAFRDPFLGLQLGPPAVHLAIVVAVLGGVAYGLTHYALQAAFSARAVNRPARPVRAAA